MKRCNPYPGLHRSPKRLADGTRKVYFYAWKGGPRLPDTYGSAEFALAYREAIAAKAPRRSMATLQSILDRYQQSRGRAGSGKGFLDLSERTRADYTKLIQVLEREFGDFPVAALAESRARHVFLAWRDELAEKSRRQADYAYTVLARILSWALDRRLILANPCERAGRLYNGSRAESVWSEEDEAAFFRVAPTTLRAAYTLAVWTGQRQGDLLRLTWAAYDGESIRLRQSKTGARVVIPVSDALRGLLDGMRRVSPVILTNSDDRPWTPNGFRTAWRRTTAKAGISGLTFNDLRGTAVTRFARAECTHAEIGAITGHKAAEVNAILDKHYLARDPALAQSAVRKLEARTKPPNHTPNRASGTGE